LQEGLVALDLVEVYGFQLEGDGVGKDLKLLRISGEGKETKTQSRQDPAHHGELNVYVTRAVYVPEGTYTVFA
jgi:hypothetical protein